MKLNRKTYNEQKNEVTASIQYVYKQFAEMNRIDFWSILNKEPNAMFVKYEEITGLSRLHEIMIYRSIAVLANNLCEC
jgi:hypothetical protein